MGASRVGEVCTAPELLVTQPSTVGAELEGPPCQTYVVAIRRARAAHPWLVTPTMRTLTANWKGTACSSKRELPLRCRCTVLVNPAVLLNPAVHMPLVAEHERTRKTLTCPCTAFGLG